MTAKRIGFVMLLAPFFYIGVLLYCAFTAPSPDTLLPIPFFDLEAASVFFFTQLTLAVIALITILVATSYLASRKWYMASGCLTVFVIAFALASLINHQAGMAPIEARIWPGVWKILTIGGVVLNWIAVAVGLMDKR